MDENESNGVGGLEISRSIGYQKKEAHEEPLVQLLNCRWLIGVEFNLLNDVSFDFIILQFHSASNEEYV